MTHRIVLVAHDGDTVWITRELTTEQVEFLDEIIHAFEDKYKWETANVLKVEVVEKEEWE